MRPVDQWRCVRGEKAVGWKGAQVRLLSLLLHGKQGYEHRENMVEN